LYFNNTLQKTPSTGSVTSSDLFTLPKSCMWNRAYVMNGSKTRIVVVPLVYLNPLKVMTTLTDTFSKIPAGNISKLILFKDGGRQWHAEVVYGLPDQAYLINRKNAFTGVSVIKDWQGDYLRGFFFTAGRVFNLTHAPAQSNIQPSDFPVTGSTTTCYYENTFINGELVDVEDLGCVTTEGGGGGEGGGSVTSKDYETVSELPDQLLDSIYNTLSNPCFQSTWTNITGAGMQNQITNILENVFNCDDTVDLTITDSRTVQGSQDAYTNSGMNGNYLNATITLSDSAMQNASQPFIAETIYHEILHAWLDVSTSTTNELAQHTTMINNYVNYELAALQQAYPSLSTHDGLCLILGGMGNIQQFAPATLDTVIAKYSQYNLTLSNIVSTNNSYKSGALGTMCP
jgi:hypothetical protein